MCPRRGAQNSPFILFSIASDDSQGIDDIDDPQVRILPNEGEDFAISIWLMLENKASKFSGSVIHILPPLRFCTGTAEWKSELLAAILRSPPARHKFQDDQDAAYA